jgi:hypothetical protein
MNLKEYKTKKMNNPEFAKAYEEIQPEMNVTRVIMDRSHFTEHNAERNIKK